MRSRGVVFAALVLLAVGFVGSARGQNPALHKVSRIHVAAMGSGAGAERFHGLLIDELRRVGFEVSEAVKEADAVLSGEFSAEASGDFSEARVALLLKSPDGKRTIWFGNYLSQHRGASHEDVVKSLAETCAERLRKEWEKG